VLEPESISIPGYSKVLVHEEVSSTMDVARQFLETQSPQLFIAKRQTAGRGRQGRTWNSSDCSFMGTFLFPSLLRTADLSGYSLAVGVAISEALENLGAAPKLKWPNDLVVLQGSRVCKLGGILIEVEERGTHRAVLVGVGVNLKQVPASIENVSSVEVAFGIVPSFSSVVLSLAETMLKAHLDFEQSGGFKAFRTRWLKRACLPTGKSLMRIDLGPERIEGLFYGIDPSGALLLRSGDTIHTVHAGHVITWEPILG